MKKTGSGGDLQKNMKKDEFRGGPDPPKSRSRFSGSAIQHFPAASKIGAKRGSKTSPKSKFWGSCWRLGVIFWRKKAPAATLSDVPP